SLERETKPLLKFKDWLELKRKNNEKFEGRYLITFIMAPKQYPFASFEFETDKEKVRFTVSSEVWVLFKNEYGITGKDIEGKEFYVIIEGKDVNIDAVEPKDDLKEPVYTFDKVKKYWKLEYKAKVSFNEDEDVVDI
ncbi:MAG: hypothetical protein ACPLX7_10050, partial [Candidatus Kapaibacteriota bacterium]